MYYEPYQKKTRYRRRRRSFLGWLLGALLRLVLLAAVLAVIGAAVLYALPPSLFAVEPDGTDLSLTDGLPSSMANVLLLGVDVLKDNSQRSDSMIIASIGYGRLRLTSVLRDTVADIPGHGSTKLNAAYAYGGANLAMRTLNMNFGLNLMHYVTVDFTSLVRIVDALGGVEVDISQDEMTHINRNVWNSRIVFQPLGYTARELTTYGEKTHLDGLQALGYARIRKLDSDFTRASRQRKLLNAMASKLRDNAWNATMWVNLGRTLPEVIETNMSVPQLLSLALKAVIAQDTDQLRLPVDGTYVDDGSSLKVKDYAANTRAFVAFAYGK